MPQFLERNRLERVEFIEYQRDRWSRKRIHAELFANVRNFLVGFFDSGQTVRFREKHNGNRAS